MLRLPFLTRFFGLLHSSLSVFTSVSDGKDHPDLACTISLPLACLTLSRICLSESEPRLVAIPPDRGMIAIMPLATIASTNANGLVTSAT